MFDVIYNILQVSPLWGVYRLRRKTDVLEDVSRLGRDQTAAELKGLYKCRDSCDTEAQAGFTLLLIQKPHPPLHSSSLTCTTTASAVASRASVSTPHTAPGCDCWARGWARGRSETWLCKVSWSWWDKHRRVKRADTHSPLSGGTLIGQSFPRKALSIL